MRSIFDKMMADMNYQLQFSIDAFKKLVGAYTHKIFDSL